MLSSQGSLKSVKISVIIPCYNDGHFLPEAVNSALSYPGAELEVIIVNDGSTDENTLAILNQFKQSGLTVLSGENKGLGNARNKGIRAAAGNYILPLDADNRVKRHYIEKAIKLLDADICDIVYGKPDFFGDDINNRKFVTHEFDGEKLFIRNYIDACAIYKKSVWEKVGGYDEHMPVQGNEDWEFWLHSYLKGFRFKFLNEHLYDYRISANSMISTVSVQQTNAVKDYLIIKHLGDYRNHLKVLDDTRLFYLNDQQNYFRTSIKYFSKWLKQLFTFSKVTN